MNTTQLPQIPDIFLFRLSKHAIYGDKPQQNDVTQFSISSNNKLCDAKNTQKSLEFTTSRVIMMDGKFFIVSL